MEEERQPTYQELLAEIYEENAANQYVVNRFYEEEDMVPFANDKYEDLEIPDRQEFNKLQANYGKPENVIISDAAIGGDGKSSYAYNKNIRTTVVNIDGRFRQEPVGGAQRASSYQTCAADVATQNFFGESSGTEFAVMLSRQYKNVTSIKLISLEFENSFYTFTKYNNSTGLGRENTTFKINLNDVLFSGGTGPLGGVTVTIPDGNYTINQLRSAIISNSLSAVQMPYPTGYGRTGATGYTGDLGYFYFNITQDPQSLLLTFSSNHNFDFIFPQTVGNFTQNGIGYNLGFYNLSQNFSTEGPTGLFTLTPSFNGIPGTRPDVIQDRYIYIVLNDWYQVHHQYNNQTELTAFLKVPLTVPKFTVQYDNIQLYTDSKEYFFPQPSNVQKLEISVIDQYGTVLDMQGGSFSMSLAINEILQSSIYEKMLQL